MQNDISCHNFSQKQRDLFLDIFSFNLQKISLNYYRKNVIYKLLSKHNIFQDIINILKGLIYMNSEKEVGMLELLLSFGSLAAVLIIWVLLKHYDVPMRGLPLL